MDTAVQRNMGLSDRHYMREVERAARRKHTPRPSLWMRVKFGVWRLLRLLRRP